MKQKTKQKTSNSKIRVADIILILVSIVLIFFSFIGFLLTNEGDWLTAALLTLVVGGVAYLLIMFMIFTKKQTNYVVPMRILEGLSLVVFIFLAIIVAMVPINHAFIAMGSSKQLSGAIDTDIQSLNESKKQYFANEKQNIETSAATIRNISGWLNLDTEAVNDVEKTMKLKDGRYYGSQAELMRLSNDYAKKYEDKLEKKSFALNQMDALIDKANDMKRDVDAGFFFSFPSIAAQMDSLASQMATLQNNKSKELGIRNLERHGAKYSAPNLSSDYQPAYTKSSFASKLYGMNENSILGIIIGFFAMILLLAVYIAVPRSKGVRPDNKLTGGISL